MDRRAFLETSALIAASSALPTLPRAAFASITDGALPEGQPAKDGYEPPSWLRYSKTIYFEGYTQPVYPVLRDFDAERLVKTAVRLGGDTLRFQAVGDWAFYPSKVFPPCPDLSGRDLVDEVSRECRKAGLHLYCYCIFDSTAMEVGYFERHPEYADWALRGPDGKLDGTSGGYGWAKTVKCCSTSQAYRQGMRQVTRELSAHDIDGVYFDAPSAFEYTGICYCESCRSGFKAYSGMDLDRLQDEKDMEARIAWFRWWNQVNLDELEASRKILHESGKFLLCHNGATWRGVSLRGQYRIPEGFMVEHSPQIYMRLMTGLMGASMARPYQKAAQMYLGSYCVSNFGQPPHCQPWSAHGTNMEDGDEILMEGFTNLACGNLPIYVSLNRAYYGIGSGSENPVREVYELMRRAEALVKDSVPVPYVSVVPTWEALQVWRTNRKTWNVEMSQGFTLAMLDERLNLDICPSTEVTANWLQKQKVVALCGATGVSAEQARMLTEWVREGGSLLATYDTGLCDDQGHLKAGGMLQKVLGVEMKGEPLGSIPECYYRPIASHPALGGYQPGERLMGDTQLIPVAPVGDARVLADCWNLGPAGVRGPAIVANNFGKGRTIYVAGSLEAHYVSSRAISLRRMLGSMVRYLANDAPPPFMIDAPRGVYGVLRQTADSDLVLWILANVGFKDADIGRMRQEFVQLSSLKVKVLVPQGRSVKTVHLVRSGQNVPFTVENGYASVEIPSVHVAEIVHLELA
jgi:Hypothetical glycosyl hydrolase 6/Beta-galactosidase trimerisation domain